MDLAHGERRRRGRKTRREVPGYVVDTSEIWIVSYADFMSLLMILFLILFVLSYQSKGRTQSEIVIANLQMTGNKKPTRDVSEQLATSQAVMQIDEEIKSQNLNDLVTVQMDKDSIKIILKAPVLFDSGACDLRSASRDILHVVGNIIRKLDTDVIIEGHTDNIPVSGNHKRYKNNWELSQSRAHSVVNFFIQDEKLPPQRFAAAGYGEYRPLVPNITRENRGRNRRIEIEIARKRAPQSAEQVVPESPGQDPSAHSKGIL